MIVLRGIRFLNQREIVIAETPAPTREYLRKVITTFLVFFRDIRVELGNTAYAT